jgi:hypothetical protein
MSSQGTLRPRPSHLFAELDAHNCSRFSGRAGPPGPPRTSSGAPGTSRPTFCRISARVAPQPHPPTRGFSGSRVTQVMADAALSGLDRGHGRPARVVRRKTGGTPVPPGLAAPVTPKPHPPRTRHESDPPGAWRPLECGGWLWRERKSAVKPAHSKIFGRGARALRLLPPGLAARVTPQPHPPTRGFRDSRVTHSVMRLTFFR